MVQLDAERSRALDSWVADCANTYSGEYPSDLTERAQASNVQAALKELGFDVSLAHAAAIWESYSGHLQAGWIAWGGLTRPHSCSFNSTEHSWHYCSMWRSKRAWNWSKKGKHSAR